MDWMELLEKLRVERRDPKRMLSLLYGLTSSNEVRASIDRQRRDTPTIFAQEVLDNLYRQFGKPNDFDDMPTSNSVEGKP